MNKDYDECGKKMHNMMRNCLVQWLTGSQKASYTVEASFMIPILIGAMVIAMRMGIGCYE